MSIDQLFSGYGAFDDDTRFNTHFYHIRQIQCALPRQTGREKERSGSSQNGMHVLKWDTQHHSGFVHETENECLQRVMFIFLNKNNCIKQ